MVADPNCTLFPPPRPPAFRVAFPALFRRSGRAEIRGPRAVLCPPWVQTNSCGFLHARGCFRQVAVMPILIVRKRLGIRDGALVQGLLLTSQELSSDMELRSDQTPLPKMILDRSIALSRYLSHIEGGVGKTLTSLIVADFRHF